MLPCVGLLVASFVLSGTLVPTLARYLGSPDVAVEPVSRSLGLMAHPLELAARPPNDMGIDPLRRGGTLLFASRLFLAKTFIPNSIPARSTGRTGGRGLGLRLVAVGAGNFAMRLSIVYI
jgi:hypothetical protein